MDTFRFIIELVALVLCACYLFFRHKERIRAQTPPDRIGHGIETSMLKPRVEQVRKDYLAERLEISGVGFHRSLLKMARRTVVKLGFFRDRETEEHIQHHGP